MGLSYNSWKGWRVGGLGVSVCGVCNGVPVPRDGWNPCVGMPYLG